VAGFEGELMNLMVVYASLLAGGGVPDTVVVGRPLPEVEITASASRRTLLTHSFSESVIDEQVIREKIASSFIDVLEEAPGITKRGEYHSPIALRGLGGKRLLVTKDGNRRMGNFQNGFMGQSVNIYDLEKVEIIKGPASVKYGPGAITGVINMRTKSPFTRPGLHGQAMTYYGTNNREKNLLASLNWANLDHALSFSSRYRSAGNFLYGQGEEAQNSHFEDKDFRLSYTWENDRMLSLNFESEYHLGGPWGRPAGFNGDKQTRMYNAYDDIWHSAANLVWSPFGRLRKVEASVFFDKERRRQLNDSYDIGSGRLSYRQDVRYGNYYAGWRGSAVFSLFKSSELTVGTDGVYYRIESPTYLTDYFLDTKINNRVNKNAGVALAGLFAEAEHQAADDRLKLRAGVRMDYSRISEGEVHDTLAFRGRQADVFAWNATLGAVYSLTGNLFLSAQLARSGRMPDAFEMFMISSNSDGVITGNPELKPEYGINIDAGIRGTVASLAFDFTLFCNFLNDFISLEYWLNSGKKGINYTYLNVEKARIAGFEFSASRTFTGIFSPTVDLVWNGMCTYIRGSKLEGGSNFAGHPVPLREIPPFNTKNELVCRKHLSSALTFNIGGDIRYYAAQNRIAPVTDGGYVSPSYCLFGASAGVGGHRNDIRWNLNLKGDNLADNRYRPFESLVYGMGRNIKILLSIHF
jgi:outer membrane receptor protein involved in Fe transport